MTSALISAVSRMRMAIDGNGVRTLVVFQACPLRCRYCPNPQTISLDSEARLYSVEDLYKLIKLDDLYFRATNGGVTFGGGEPLLQSEFIKEFVDATPEWSFWVETSLNVPYSNIERVSGSIDKFMIDVKTADEAAYKAYTGKNNVQVKSNLERLVNEIGSGKIKVRVPNIPGYTTKESIEKTVDWLCRLGITDIDRFTYQLTLPTAYAVGFPASLLK